jgi:formate hydrogenlyase subunit 6/NADH:ubiquinone oxidoreductase subunit I
MIIEAVKNLFRRRFTQKREFVPKGIRGKHIYEPDKCESLGMCIRYCPTNAIKFRKDRKIKIDLGKCIFCGMCEEFCPKGAIKLSNVFKMATAKKSVINEEKGK